MNKTDIKNTLEGGRLINFYKLKVMDDYKSNIDDKEYKEKTGFEMGDHILFTGKTKSGKSLAFMNYLYICQNLLKHKFYDKIFILAKKKEALTEMLKDNLGKDFIEIYYNINEFPPVESFADGNKLNKSKYLVVFDDQVNEKKQGVLKKIQDYFTFGRNKNINIIFLTQSYYQTDIFIRKQCSYVCLCGISGENDLNNILRDFKSPNVNLHTLSTMYKFCKVNQESDDEPTFLKIYTQNSTENKRFTFNFITPLKPKDFIGVEIDYDD
jgi:hypothetical protein